jgi:hypothetical protein
MTLELLSGMTAPVTPVPWAAGIATPVLPFVRGRAVLQISQFRMDAWLRNVQTGHATSVAAMATDPFAISPVEVVASTLRLGVASRSGVPGILAGTPTAPASFFCPETPHNAHLMVLPALE